MDKSIVLKKIDKMPDALMGTIAELLDKLLEGYEIGRQSTDDFEFTEEELKELDRRHQEMISHPERTKSWEEVAKFMKEKHGL